MKATGIVRKLDELGRITLPMELRRTMDIKEADPLQIFVNDDQIVLKKYISDAPKCALCGAVEDLHAVDGGYVCRKHALSVTDMVMENGL
ncbi:MAG: AbrB family transcriptional regulator [Herbinix sp.]|jgi:transcriptional pleiotropic regulator of transition state genes|nr:AbrB family transcriptional regulator [Herbinix sp.]